MGAASRLESASSNNDSSKFAEQEETSSLDNVEWTDEKHRLYLKSMEASFVDQLYNFKDFFSWGPSGSGQFKIQQHCQWPSKSRKMAPQPEVVDGSGKFPEKQLSKYCKEGGSFDVVQETDAFEHQSLRSSCGLGNKSRLFTDGECHQVSLNEECSDQNFIDEDCENRAPSGQRKKRPRTLDTSAELNNDQVVPFGISSLPMQDRNEGCSSRQENDRAR